MPDDEAERRIASGDDAGAAARLEEVLRAGGRDADEASGLLLRLATCLFRLGKFAEALSHARRVADDAASSHRADAAFFVAEIHRKGGRPREAAVAYLTAASLQTDPARRKTAAFLATLALEETGDLATAEEGYKAFLAEWDDEEGHYRLGLLAEKRGDAGAARAAYDRIVARSSGPAATEIGGDIRPAALFRLGLLDREAGNAEGAIRRLEEAAEMCPGTFLATTARALAEELRAERTLAKRRLAAYDPKI